VRLLENLLKTRCTRRVQIHINVSCRNATIRKITFVGELAYKTQVSYVAHGPLVIKTQRHRIYLISQKWLEKILQKKL
jgi:hypothetical protein